MTVVYASNPMRLPFYARMLDSPFDNLGLPLEFPIEIDVDHKLGTMRQVPSHELEKALERAYNIGSVITGQMTNWGIGKAYTSDFLTFILDLFRDTGITGQRVLEIGCGTGYLLSQLKRLGASVLGIEPGYDAFDGREMAIPVISDFFPSPAVTEHFDLIVLYGVLEHMVDPVAFLTLVSKYLVPTGRVVVSVPDCKRAIQQGDISILVHEHFSFFTESTLHNLLCRVHFRPDAVLASAFGGAIYAGCSIGESTQMIATKTPDLDAFFRQANALCAKIRTLLLRCDRLGIYVPARMINYLYLLWDQDLARKLVLIDDNPLCAGRYFPGIPIPCQPFNRARDTDLDGILIASSSFGKGIEKKIRESMSIPVWHLVDL